MNKECVRDKKQSNLVELCNKPDSLDAYRTIQQGWDFLKLLKLTLRGE